MNLTIMTNNYKYLPLLLILCCFQHLLYAQLEVTPGDTPPFEPETILENYFFGGGVEVLNITYNGADAAVGFFDGENSNIGIDRGIILTSGNAINAEGPNEEEGVTTAHMVEGEEDLELLIPGFSIFDPAVYEIQFIPYDTIVRFTYVWASDEYIEFVNAGFNDVFGFFISGPGINGPFSNNAENIAYLPDGVTPVSIDNVNDDTNAIYYQSNIGGATVEYDGFTVPLEAFAVVVPCDTYNIKIAVSDAGDSALDSGVFLASGSFGTDALNISVNTFAADSTMVEGCVGAAIEFQLGIPAEADFTLDYTIFGDAINGIDYSSVPLNAFIPAGEDSLTLFFDPIEDGIPEGLEVIYIDVKTNICGRDTFALYIGDNQLVPPQLDADATICEGESRPYDATLPIELPENVTFINDQTFDIPDNDVANPLFSTIEILGAIPEQIAEGSILSVCIDITHSWDGDLDIYLIAPSGQFLTLTTDNGGSGDNYTQTCFTSTAVNPIEGLGTPEAPFTGDYLPESPWEDIYGADMNGVWKLQISDDSGGFAGTLNNWSITLPPIYTIGYLWEPAEGVSNPNLPNVDLSPTTTTTYTVTAFDTYGCTTSDEVTITVTPALPAPTITCDNSTDGQITFSWAAVAGAMGYEVNVDETTWVASNGGTSHTITGLTDGQTVTIEVRGTDGGCGTLSATLDCTAVQMGCALTASLNDTQDVTCFDGNDGQFTVSAEGGTMPYSYEILGTVSTSGTFENLAAGTYNVNIIDDMGCPATQIVTLSEPDSLALSISVDAISCSAGNDASITMTATGGTADYTYSIDGTNFQTDNTFENLSAGTYSLTVNDANSCAATANLTITEPSVIVLMPSATPVSCNGGEDGTATITPTGGTPSFTYIWDANANNQSTQTATGLATGTYTVTVTDANDCASTAQINITEPDAMTLTSTNTAASCNGGIDGTATITANNGATPYTYQWDTNASNQNGPTAVGLALGSYAVTVTDANGCEVSEQVDVPELSSLEYTTAGTLLNCFGDANGIATVQVNSGTEPYIYSWNTTPPQTTAAAIDLASGTYIVTITDGGGCGEVVSIDVTEPDELTVDILPTPALCTGAEGAISSSISGGTAPYTYAWDNGTNLADINAIAGTYTLTLTDANGCSTSAQSTITEPTPLSFTANVTDVLCSGNNDGVITVSASGGTTNYTYSLDGINFQNGNMFENLAAATYTVYVNDGNDCTANQEFTIAESAALVLMLDTTSESCAGNDGTATVTASNGTGTYTYTWSDGQSTPTASTLNAGTYTVSVTDDNGCIATGSTDVISDTDINIGITVSDVSCAGLSDGSAGVIADGTPPFTYQWDAATGNQTDATAFGLSGGTYDISVTDGNDCTSVTTIVINEPQAISLDISGEDILCNSTATGSASVSASGGTGTYIYEWNDGTLPNTAAINDLLPGDYTVTVTDQNGCQEAITISIAQPESVALTGVGSTLDCFGDTNGTITLNAVGGTPPYSYSIDNENFTQGNIFIGLTGGEYTVYVSDATGECTAQSIVTVIEPPLLTVDAGEDLELLYGDSITLEAVPSDFGGFTYTWSSLSPSLDLTCTDCPTPQARPLNQIMYTVTIENENGCTATDNVRVFISKEQPVFVATGFTPNGDSFNDILYVQGGEAAKRVVGFKVFDRWGELVFDNRDTALNDKESGWDGSFKGQEMQPGVYAWMAEVRFVDGSVVPYMGEATLIR